MTKFVAKLGILVAQLALMFVNYWFAFGLWPKSWPIFLLCGLGSIVLMGLNLAVDAEKK